MVVKRATPNKRLRVVLYFRNSRDTQESSVDRQKSLVMPYAERQGWDIVAVIEDDGVSGVEVAKRRGLQQLLAMCKAGQVDGIGVDDFDRLLRLDMLEMGELLSPLRRAGIFIESAAQGRFDYASMSGRLQLGITSEAKHGEIVATARRALSEHIRMACDLGNPPLAKTPYGYIRIEDVQARPNRQGRRPGRWVIDPVKANVVKTVFEWYASGRKIAWICRELRNRGIPNSAGSLWWYKATIRQWLTNPAYAGDRAWGKGSKGKFFRAVRGELVSAEGCKRWEAHPREEWIFANGSHDPIVSRELWTQVQTRLEQSKRREVKDEDGAVLRVEGEASDHIDSRGSYLFTKLLVCGSCGSFMHGVRNPRGDRGKAYLCTKYDQCGLSGCPRCLVKEELLFTSLIDQLRNLLSPERQAFLRRALKERIEQGGNKDRLKELRQTWKSLTAQLAKYKTRLLEVSKDMLGEVEDSIRRVREELKEAEEKLKDAESADPVKDLSRTVEAASAALWNLEESLETNDRFLIQAALRGIVEKVVVRSAEYKTKTGKTWRRPSEIEVTLRRGTGLEMLGIVDWSRGETMHVLNISLQATA